jgi:hypothetical protein
MNGQLICGACRFNTFLAVLAFSCGLVAAVAIVTPPPLGCRRPGSHLPRNAAWLDHCSQRPLCSGCSRNRHTRGGGGGREAGFFTSIFVLLLLIIIRNDVAFLVMALLARLL